MAYTFERAAPGAVTGRIVGGAGQHVAVAVRGDHVLAVRLDGRQYVTWTFGYQGEHVVTFWGHYFDAAHYGSEAGAYDAAHADLMTSPANTLVTAG